MFKIEIDNIELHYNNTTILNAIYLKATKGKITGILGRNGSGKTSLLRIIFGELIPNNKLIRIDNLPILTPLYQKKVIKYLPQFNFIHNSFSLKNVFNYYRVSFQQFLIDFPDFTYNSNFKFSNYSGGEKRIIETYLILKSHSKIVLLDEPFSYVAPIHIEKIKELIQQEKDNKIIILTDHYYEQILNISDAVYLIENGRSREINSKKDLVTFNYIRSI
jgi:ABC-type multidrug transport system ATPase subunit